LSIFLHNISQFLGLSIQPEKERDLYYYNIVEGNIQRAVLEKIFKITGKKSGYGITHSIYSLIGISLSMEPKSIAFYTAVAVSILAVISATTFPSLVLAQPAGQGQSTQVAESNNTVDETDPPADEGANANTADETDSPADSTDSTESNDESDEGGATNDNGAGSQSLGLDPSNGVASCGEVVTEDVVLTADLQCDGDGLIVDADNVAINLNGYKISSAGETDSTDLATGYDGNSGILVTDADNVVISGLGGIEGFDAGVRFLGSSGGEVSDVAFTNNNVGIVMSGAQGTEISRNTMTNNGFAIVSASSNEATMAFNSAVANELQGIVLTGSDDNVIAANSLYGNGDNGIYVDIMSTGNTIDFNTAYGHETADLNNADGQPTSVNGNTYGEHNNCGISLPAGLCG
jgi:parallel beta-helix repeat protein